MFPTAGSDRASPAALHLSTDAVEPEASSGWTPRSGWSGTRQMVAAANPLATEAGLLILRAGGSAVDAAVAVQLVLTLVEPQSSGIGGGGLMLTWDGARVQAWDGRETAPAAAREDQFLTPTGRPVPIQEAVFGGRAVATPGVLRLLETVHRQHGRLPWARLFEPAIRLADEGFPVGPRLHRLLDIDPLLRRDPIARTWFYRPDGSPWPVGYRLRNPALAQVLRQVAARGSAAFHEGSIARAMVRAVRQSAVPGGLSEGDLRDYQAVLRQPLCTGWLDRLTVCGFPPPSSGHLALMQILGLLAASDLPEARQGLQGEVPSAEWLHAYNEAARLAYADRAQYVADPAYVAAPGGRWEQLLDAGYLRQRAQHMRSAAARQVAPGDPPTWSERPASASGPATMAYAPMADQPEFGTSHISIVDSRGHAVAFTTTIEASFGARVMSDGGTGLPGGFLLNNQMTDFALAPRDASGRPVANRVEPGKRPRSSMSPTLVFDAASGRLLMSTGSPGGGAIIHFTAKMLVATQQWGLDVQQAINLPNFVQINGPLLLETGRFPRETQDALRARGHTLEERDLTSGIQAIERRGSGWFGGADPRREGVVRAD